MNKKKGKRNYSFKKAKGYANIADERQGMSSRTTIKSSTQSLIKFLNNSFKRLVP
jgi:hypothetical protein